MFDHVGIAASDLAASERFYRTVLSVLGVEPSHAGSEMVGWDDWWIASTDRGHPVTRGLHVGFRAPDRATVDAFWQAGIDAGHPDDGAPGPRTVSGPNYYGGFLLDPDGNSVEAVYDEREQPVPDGRIDHLWLRVRDPRASRRFYTTIAPYAGLGLSHDAPDRVQLAGPDFSFSLVRDEHPLTVPLHLPFRADADATVRGPSTRPRSPLATRTTAPPASAPSPTAVTTAPSCSTPTATTSRSSTTIAESCRRDSGDQFSRNGEQVAAREQRARGGARVWAFAHASPRRGSSNRQARRGAGVPAGDDGHGRRPLYSLLAAR